VHHIGLRDCLSVYPFPRLTNFFTCSVLRITNVSITNCTCSQVYSVVIPYYFLLHILALLGHHLRRGKLYKAPVKSRYSIKSILQMHYSHKKIQKLFHLHKCCMYHTQKGARLATRYGLDGAGIESRWGARFSAPTQTGLGPHTATYTMVTRPLSRG
jgi:hypothetical protein